MLGKGKKEDGQEKQRCLAEVPERAAEEDQDSLNLASSSSSTSSTSSSISNTSSSSNVEDSMKLLQKGPGVLASQTSNKTVGICRICLEEDDIANLETPCSCSGTQRYAHHACIQRWVEEKGNKRCEICEHLYRGAYIIPPPQPSIPEHLSVNAGGPSRLPVFVMESAEARLAEALEASQPGRIRMDDDEGDVFRPIHPGTKWCFTFMMFFMFLVVLNHTILVLKSEDYDDGSGAIPIADGEAPLLDPASQDEMAFSSTLFVFWILAKLLIVGIPLCIVTRIAARQAQHERYEALQMAQIAPRGRLVLQFAEPVSAGSALVQPGVV